MTLYYQLLYLFLEKEIYSKYKDSIPLQGIKTSIPIVYKLFLSLFKLQETTDNSASTLSDLRLIFDALYPNENKKEVDFVFNHIITEGSSAKKELLLKYLNITDSRLIAYDIAQLGIEVSDGYKDTDALVDGLRKALERLEGPSQKESFEFVTDDLEELYNERIKTQGHRWRLDSLNASLGSLRKGDFGFVFARPETGKTTFLASEITFMASQLPPEVGPILWINNEEQGSKVMLRCYQAALDRTHREIFSNIKEAGKEFNKLINHKIKIYDSAKINRKEVEEVIRSTNPSLIVIDQIDKIGGFNNDRKDLELGAIYIWARELAKSQCAVIGISQADGSGEGVKALTMNHVANAKTSKQAEADFILGIGKGNNSEQQNVRYFNISKNKLIGDEDTNPDRRHDYWEVEIDPNHARYRDFEHPDDYANLRQKK